MNLAALTLLLCSGCATMDCAPMPSLPISVYAVRLKHTGMTRIAIEQWNKATGREIFKWLGAVDAIPPPPAVYVTTETPAPNAWADAECRGELRRIRVLDTIPIHRVAEVVAHELGHVGGLDHDAAAGSIMSIIDEPRFITDANAGEMLGRYP